MSKKFLCLVNSKIDQEIEFKKIGFKFRNINDEEIEIIKLKIESIYCSDFQRNLYFDYLKAKQVGSNEKNVDIIKEAINTYKKIDELDNEQKFVFYFLVTNNGKIEINEIIQRLKKCIVVEVDESNYKGCFDRLDEKFVIFRLFNFSNYLGEKYSLMNFFITEFDSFNEYDHIVNNHSYGEVDSIVLNKIAKMLRVKNNINFEVNYVLMIESLLTNEISFENKIVNMISIIEKILIKEKDDKQESFKYKIAILIGNDAYFENTNLLIVLKTIYEYRSLLVHGEFDKIYEKKNIYAQVFNNEELITIQNKIELRYKISSMICGFLEHITREILNKQIDNLEFCEYLKAN